MIHEAGAICVVCRGWASHNYGGQGCVCDQCCPGCGKTGSAAKDARERFDAALDRRKARVAS